MGKGAKIVGKKGPHKKNPSGQKQIFGKAEQKFYLQFKMTDPADPAKLIDFPEGITVKLMNKGKPIANPVATAVTDAGGKVVVAADKATSHASPSYHFRIDLDERTFYDIDAKKIIPGTTIKESDDRNLMELPMVMDTSSDDFYYDDSKLHLKKGMLKNYPAHKKGEGTPGANIILEVRFYWFYLRFKFYDPIRDDVQDVPRGLPVLPVVDNEEYFARMVKNEAAYGYAIDTNEKRALHYLKLLGFFKGKVDAPLGKDGKDAIKQFQQQHGLDKNSTLDDPTRNMLERVFYRRNTGIYKGGSYWVPVWKKKKAMTEVNFELAVPVNKLVTDVQSADFDLFLYTKEKTATPVLVTRKKIATDNKDKDGKEVPYDKLDYFKKRLYYDLPVKWSSRNYWTRYNNVMTNGERFSEVMKTKVTLYPFVNDEAKRQDKTKPLMFSFDDIVLVKADGSQDIADKDAAGVSLAPNPFKADTGANKDGSRLTMFHVNNGELVVYDREEVKRPYFSKVTATSANFTSNVIPNAPKNARLVVFASDFYDITNKRTAQKAEPYNKAKHILGARAAMLNDPDCHFGEGLVQPGTPLAALFKEGAAFSLGNFEHHYLHDCCAITEPDKCDKLVKRSFLVLYWNGRFSTKDYIPIANRTIDHVDPSGTTIYKQVPDATVMNDGHKKNFEIEGMENAKKRWDDKGYTMEPIKLIADGGTCYHQIKPICFFEAKKSGIGGKEKCRVDITNDQKEKGWMTPVTSKMFWEVYQDQLDWYKYTDIDGKVYKWLTVAHELGHALGRHDDYSYADRFGQYYTGMPYQFDEGSMMLDNRAPRMRHFYNALNWVNQCSVDPNKLKKFFDNTQFAVVHRFGKNTLRFHLPDALRDIYIYFKVKKGLNVGTGTVDLALYRLGVDETAYNLSIKSERPKLSKDPFNAIVVVYIKIAVIFKNGSAGAWTPNDKNHYITSLRAILNDLNQRFYLEADGTHDYKRTYLGVFPVCLEKSAPDPDSNYDVEVTLDDSSSITGRTGKSVKVGNEVNKHWVANYILGDDDGAVAAFFKWTLGLWSLGASELKFARDWMRTELGDNSIDIESSLW